MILRKIICFLLAIWGVGIAQTYQYGQLLEGFIGIKGNVFVIWRTSGEEFRGSSQDADNSQNSFMSTNFKKLNGAYGQLLEELGTENNPDIENNELELRDYLGSLGLGIIICPKGR